MKPFNTVRATSMASLIERPFGFLNDRFMRLGLTHDTVLEDPILLDQRPSLNLCLREMSKTMEAMTYKCPTIDMAIRLGCLRKWYVYWRVRASIVVTFNRNQEKQLFSFCRDKGYDILAVKQ